MLTRYGNSQLLDQARYGEGKNMKLQKIFVAAAVFIGLLALAVGVSPAQGAPAQQANMLNNPSMEGGTYMYNNDGDMRDVPNGWTPWYINISDSDCAKARYKPHFEIEAHPSHVKDGTFSARYWTGYQIHDGGLMQSVAATPGTTYKFSIYGFSWTTDNPVVDSASTSQQSLRVGIDPTGGTNGAAASVVWSAESWTNDQFILLSVEAAATADKITVFTRTKPNWCIARNDSFWDQATLIATGQGPTPAASSAAKTAVPTQSSNWGVQAGTIITATPQADGSIIHTVSSGESCTGIVVAYNISLDDFYSLNNLSNDKCRFISPGQTLIIRPAQQPTAPPPTATSEQQVAEATSESGAGATEAAAPVQQNGTICVMGYEDSNSNGLLEPAEVKLAGMTIEVSDGTQVIGTYTTDAQTEPYCFAQVPPGSYVVSWTGDGLTPTTEQSWSVDLTAGSTVSHQFGAQAGTAGGANDSVSGPSQGSGLPGWAMALLLAVGVMLLLSGAGVAGYFVLMRRAKI
jgi:LysM repeat protein